MPANYVLLEKVTLSASAASVTLDNIPQTGYTDLVVKASIRTSYAGSFDSVYIYPNGSSANGTRRALYGTGGGTVGSESASNIRWDYLSADTATAGTFGSGEVYIPNYTSSNFKSFAMEGFSENNSTATAMAMSASLWSNTSAITSLQFTPLNGSFLANSTFYLYGLAAVGTTPEIAPFASGGDIVTNDGTYWYHAFTSSGTFTANKSLTADILVVAGGAGAGGDMSGGGGAGGVIYFASNSLDANNYTCAIGAGGASATGFTRGSNGVNSTFGSLTAAVGGGGGGAYPNDSTAPGVSGGSGGGAGGSNTGANPKTGGSSTQTLGTGTDKYGNAGGDSYVGSSYYSGGGGGGAGANGTAVSLKSGGAGGNGTSAFSSWGLATTTGQNVAGTVYYAGGGGGGSDNSTQAAGGYGGGATGGNSGSTSGNPGTANTGGGGGGCRESSSATGSGGSGIVIVRYPIA